ncbi:MAG: type II secretion system F family protein [Acidaminococcaceae bacterium]
MNVYQWCARDKQGKKFCGELRAGSEEEVAEFIRANYGYVTKIKKNRNYRELYANFHSEKFAVNDVFRESFFRQLSSLLEGGISLIKGLEMIKLKSRGGTYDIANLLIENLNRGLSLATAMKKQKDIFTPASVKIIEAGENSGSLSVLLGELADYYKNQSELKRFIRNACIYPCIVVSLTACTFIFFVFKVLPMFVELYSSFGIEQSNFLKLIDYVGNVLKYFRWEANSFFLFFLGIIYCQRGRIKEGCLKLPEISGCYRKMMEIRYCRILSIMLKSGIAIPIALTAAADALQSREMKEKSSMASYAVMRGARISQAIALNGELLSETSIEFVSIGEDSGKLPEMLTEASEIIDAELQDKLKNLKAAIEPLLLIIIAILVGCIIFSVATPIMGLISGMPEYI